MIDTVGQLLAERRRPWRPSLTAALAAAALLHALVLALAVFASAGPPQGPVEYVAVQIVPLQALGTPQPPAPRLQAPPPEPEPAPPEPEPAAPEEPAPTLPDPETRDRRPEPRPEPASPAPRQPVGATDPARPSQEPGEGGRQGSPLGSPQGFSVFGANRFEGIDPDFAGYDYYIDQMLAMIHSQWVRPPTEGEVRAVVRFVVGREGAIGEVELIEPSGFNAFDLAALRAVGNAGPLPPLPASYRKDSLRVTLIVR